MPHITHSDLRIPPDPARVVIRPFHIAPDPRPLKAGQVSRARRIVDAVLAMDMRTCESELALVNQDFGDRHWQTRGVHLERYAQIKAQLGLKPGLRETRKALIGAYFCHEYSYAGAALTNPSITPHPDQTGLVGGAVRIVLSMRAVGEGHISSIAFREGIVTPDGKLALMPEPRVAMAAHVCDPPPEGIPEGPVAACRYEEASLSGTVIFPFTQAQRNGLEDLRLVRFMAPGEDPVWYGTYTAYSGMAIASEMLVTRDFRDFDLLPMSGTAARNKGMALFPRKIGGRYAMIGRQDGENIWFLHSNDLLDWNGGERIVTPRFPWELVQMGNCGSPMEIDEGWLLLTHGVGAMRKYAIGAVLLDKDDPTKVLGRTATPLISPSDENREGYVPNVVYTCGGLVIGRRLVLPYGVADSSIAFCSLDVDELVGELV
ncbi:MAG: glycoside hydrolase family 130 protein [Caulobacter sp.]|nr:glycoside hydrolase family 130 protein [Caulobacter sp.]